MLAALPAMLALGCGDDGGGAKDTGDTAADSADSADSEPADSADSADSEPADTSDTADSEPADTSDSEPADTSDTEPADTEPADSADTADTADTAEPIHLRMQAGFPTLPAHADSDLGSALGMLLDSFERWAQRVEEMSGGALLIEILPCCDAAATGSVHEAVSNGAALDGAQAIAAYLYNTSSRLRRTAGLFDGGFSELDSLQLMRWMESGGGQELYDELMTALGYDVVVIPFGPIPSQNLGWFPSALSAPEELVGLRYRTAGISAEMAGELGMIPTSVGAGALVSSLAEGTLDACEFNTPASDLALGMHTAEQPAPCDPDGDCRYVYHLGGLGQVAEWFDLVVNRGVYDALTPEQQEMMREAARLESETLPQRLAEADAAALAILRAQVEVVDVPASIVQAMREAWTRVIDCPAADADDLFCRVVDSIEAFAGCAIDADASPIKIGELYDGGGGSKALFDSLPAQTELVLTEVNADCGTVGTRRKGARVERVLRNSEDNPAIAATLTEEVVAEGVVFVAGEQGSGTAVPSATVAVSQHGVVFGASLGSGDALTGCTAAQLADPAVEKVATPVDEIGKCWDHRGLFFRTTVTSTAWGGAAASYSILRKPEVTVGAVLYRDDAFGRAAARGFKQTFEASADRSAPVSVPFAGGAGKDVFTALLGTLVAGNPKVIPGVFRAAEFKAFLEAWAEAEATDADFAAAHGDVTLMAIGTVRVDHADLSEAARTILATRVLGLVPHFSETAPGYARWFQVFQAADPNASAFYHGQPRAYDATMVFMLAMTAANSTDPDVIKTALRKVSNPPGEIIYPGEFAKARKLLFDGVDIDYEGASGSVDIDETGNIGPAPYLVYGGNLDGSPRDIEVYTP